MYASNAEIQSEVPFTLDTNSKPTLLRAQTIQSTVNKFINGYIGVRTDKTSLQAVNDMSWVEKDLVVDIILALHDGTRKRLELREEHKVLLDNHRSKANVSLTDFYFGYD